MWHCFVLPNAVGNLQCGERYVASLHRGRLADYLDIGTSTWITLFPSISNVVKFTTSKYYTTSCVNGQLISALVLKPTMKMSIWWICPSRISFPSFTYPHMAPNARSDTPSTIPAVWDARMVKQLNKSGLTSISLLYQHERWGQEHAMPRWMTTGGGGIGGRS